MERSKRLRRGVTKAAQEDENLWECSLCTFKNSPGSFTCHMCDNRKGTSTRKVRVNTVLAVQRALSSHSSSAAVISEEETPVVTSKPRKRKFTKNSFITAIDGSSCKTYDITVGNATVTISDYAVKDNTQYFSDSD